MAISVVLHERMTRPLLGPFGSAAAAYARRGWPVIPLHTPVSGGCTCAVDTCSSIGKHPRISRWREAATTDLGAVTRWWRQWPHANIGIATGQPSGLVVIDIDAPSGGEATYAELRRSQRFPRTALAATGSGRHLYFAVPDGRRIPNSVGAVGDGIDIRADGGYVVAPPSRHANGRAYRWIGSRPVERLPASLVATLTPPEREPVAAPTVTHIDAYARAAYEQECADMRAAPVHTRNNTLNRAAFSLGQLIDSTGLTEAVVFDGLLAAALDVGLPRREAILTIRSGMHGGRSKPRSVARTPDTVPGHMSAEVDGPSL